MKITGNTQQVQTPAARTTKPGTGTGKPKEMPKTDNQAAAREAQMKKENAAASQQMKKNKSSVDVTA